MHLIVHQGRPDQVSSSALDRPLGAPTVKLPQRTSCCYPSFHAFFKTQGAHRQNFGGASAPAAPSSVAPGTLDSAHIILTDATAGSERAPQGFMLSMQSTTIYCCVGGLCGAPLHGSWV